MNCANHPDQAAVAFCRACGKALCASCQRTAQGTVLCEEHAALAATPAAAGSPPPFGDPYTAPLPPQPYASAAGVSPGLAFLLGLIPGVGAIYNGQYAKGLVHAVIFGLLVSINSSDAAGELEPLIVMMTLIFFLYQAFEAYHTAQRRLRGEPVDEFSSLVPLGAGAAGRSGFPIGPVVIILIGILFLLNTLDVLRLHDVLRFWPIALILLGAWMLYARLTSRPEVSRE
ncbi:MAG TPA: B-box zinc finger protein [Bryobacteraceae bacterium]|nr:B-box zinc finger protein [Bryobacteraceae bacterium]